MISNIAWDLNSTPPFLRLNERMAFGLVGLNRLDDPNPESAHSGTPVGPISMVHGKERTPADSRG